MRIALIHSELDNLPEKVSRVNPYGPTQMGKTIKTLTRALVNGGHEVFPVAANLQMLENVMKIGDVDVIFCHYMPMLDLNNQGNVFAALELLGIPMVGSGMYPQAVSLSKETTKLVLKDLGIPTAPSQIFFTGDEELKPELKDRFPLFVKPESEAQSVGVEKDSLVNNEEELRASIARILKIVKPPIIVEEYLPGREFTIGVLDLDPPIALPVFEFLFEDEDDVKFQSVERKAKGDIKTQCPADIPDELRDEMQEIAINAFRAIRAKGYFRVDFRIDRDGKAQVIEVNIMPGLEEDKSFFNKAALVAGIEYEDLINMLVDIAYKKDQRNRDFETGRF